MGGPRLPVFTSLCVCVCVCKWNSERGELRGAQWDKVERTGRGGGGGFTFSPTFLFLIVASPFFLVWVSISVTYAMWTREQKMSTQRRVLRRYVDLHTFTQRFPKVAKVNFLKKEAF